MSKLVRAKTMRLLRKTYEPPRLTTYGSITQLTAAGTGHQLEDLGGQTICNSGGDVKKIRC